MTSMFLDGKHWCTRKILKKEIDVYVYVCVYIYCIYKLRANMKDRGINVVKIFKSRRFQQHMVEVIALWRIHRLARTWEIPAHTETESNKAI